MKLIKPASLLTISNVLNAIKRQSISNKNPKTSRLRTCLEDATYFVQQLNGSGNNLWICSGASTLKKLASEYQWDPIRAADVQGLKSKSFFSGWISSLNFPYSLVKEPLLALLVRRILSASKLTDPRVVIEICMVTTKVDLPYHVVLVMPSDYYTRSSPDRWMRALLNSNYSSINRNDLETSADIRIHAHSTVYLLYAVFRGLVTCISDGGRRFGLV